mgnify:CR=1 FL=1
MTTTDNAKSVFYCDEHDSLDYNGYKLYRLILENPPEHFIERFPDDFDANQNIMIGGYVENADNFNCDNEYYVHWVDQNSIVAGTVIPNKTFVEKSLLENVRLIDKGPGRITETMAIDSTLANNMLRSDIRNSYCNHFVSDSTISNSSIKNIQVAEAIINNSTLYDKSRAFVHDVNLTNVTHDGSLVGTFSDMKRGDISSYVIDCAIDRGPYRPTDDSFLLFQDKNGHIASSRHGDTTKEQLLSELNERITIRPNGTGRPVERKVGNNKSISLIKSLPDEVSSDIMLSASDLENLVEDGLTR